MLMICMLLKIESTIFERLHNCENVKYVISQNDVINTVSQLPDYVRAPLATYVLNDYRVLAQEAENFYLSGRHHSEKKSSNKSPLLGSHPAKRLYPVHLMYASIITDLVRVPRSVYHIVNTITITIRIRTRETCNKTNGKSHYPWTTGAAISGNRQNSSRCFFVDIGAHISMVPSSWLDGRSGPTVQHIQAANGTSIANYGTRNVLLHFGSHRHSSRLGIADVKRLLLGADFLRQHSLLVDVHGQRLIEADVYLSVL